MDLATMYNTLGPSNLNAEQQMVVNNKLMMGQRRRSNFVKAGEKENALVHHPCKPPMMACFQSTNKVYDMKRSSSG